MKNNRRNRKILKGVILCLALSIIGLYEDKGIKFKDNNKEVGIMLFEDIKDFDMSKLNIKINTKDKVVANEEFNLDIVIENNSTKNFVDCSFKAIIDERLEIVDNDSSTILDGNQLMWYLPPDALEANSKYELNIKLKVKKDVKVDDVLTNEFILPGSEIGTVDVTPKNVKNKITIVKNKVNNPNTGLEYYISYAIGGVLVIGVIAIISKSKRKTYKI